MTRPPLARDEASATACQCSETPASDLQFPPEIAGPS